MKKNSVAVLLSTYNGSKYLNNLIDSVLSQINVNVTLIIRDDGSTDDTLDIINSYMNKNKNIKLIKGENVGYAKSFMELIRISGEYDYYAFCDQDDIWLNNKLAKAIEKIKSNCLDEVPALYTSRVISINSKREVISENTFKYNRVLSVNESFQLSAFPGCVFVFNNSAKKVISKFNGNFESHDWMVYSIISVFGKVLYDDNSYIHYRIHSSNAIGKPNKLNYYKIRIKRFFSPSKHTRSIYAKDFYNSYRKQIPQKYEHDIYLLGHYRDSLKNKIELVFNNRYHGIIFKIYVILNKV